jgi:hypothetical protein
MSGVSSGRLAAAAVAVLAAAACAPRDLEPVERPITGDLPGSLTALAGPNTRLIVGRNGGAAINGDDGRVRVFAIDPGTLVAAAATVTMPVCSVELQRLVTSSHVAGPDEITVGDAAAACDGFDLRDVVVRLGQQKTAASKVVIGTNVGISMGGTDLGINYYWDEDVVRLLRASRKLYVSACVVVPETLAWEPYEGMVEPGLTIEEALARCAF